MRTGLALALMAAGTAVTPTATKQTLSIGDGNHEDRIAYERWATELRPCTPVDVTSAKRPIPDDWVLFPRPECPLWQFGIRRADQSRLRGNGTDCAVRTFGSRAADVILTGRLEGNGNGVAPGDRYVLVTTDMCRVVGDASQWLTDADIAELSAPRPRTQRKCPPLPRRPAPVPQPAPAPAGPRSEADELNL